MQRLNVITLFIILLTLTACGGGGGGGTTPTPASSKSSNAISSEASSSNLAPSSVPTSSSALSSSQQSSLVRETASINVTTNEYGSANKNQFVAEKGQSTEIELTPLFGYAISSIDGCNGMLINNTYRIQTISADCQVTVYFAQTLDFELELAVNAESSTIKYIAQLSGNRVLTVSQTENGGRVLNIKSTQDDSISVSWVFDQSDALTHLFWRIDNNTSNALIFTKEGAATNVSYRSPLGTSWNLGTIDFNSVSSTAKLTAQQPAKLKLALFDLDELIEGHREWIARAMLNHSGGIAFNFEFLLDWANSSDVKLIMQDGLDSLIEKVTPLIESFKTKTEIEFINAENLVKLQKNTAPDIQITIDDIDEMPELKPETAQAIQNLSDDIRAKVDAVKFSYTDIGATNQLLNTEGNNIQEFGVPGIEGSTGANGGNPPAELTAVTNLSVSPLPDNFLWKRRYSLTWEPVDGAEGYHIYVQKNSEPNTDAEPLGVINGENNSTWDYYVEEDGLYYFNVRPIRWTDDLNAPPIIGPDTSAVTLQFGLNPVTATITATCNRSLTQQQLDANGLDYSVPEEVNLKINIVVQDNSLDGKWSSSIETMMDRLNDETLQAKIDLSQWIKYQLGLQRDSNFTTVEQLFESETYLGTNVQFWTPSSNKLIIPSWSGQRRLEIEPFNIKSVDALLNFNIDLTCTHNPALNN